MNEARTKGRLQLFLLGVIFLGPLLIAYFLYNHGKDAIIEFKTNKPLLFKNHSVYIGDGIYRWITWAEVENHQHKEQND